MNIGIQLLKSKEKETHLPVPSARERTGGAGDDVRFGGGRRRIGGNDRRDYEGELARERNEVERSEEEVVGENDGKVKTSSTALTLFFPLSPLRSLLPFPSHSNERLPLGLLLFPLETPGARSLSAVAAPPGP